MKEFLRWEDKVSARAARDDAAAIAAIEKMKAAKAGSPRPSTAA
jgi:hypothetical protein